MQKTIDEYIGTFPQDVAQRLRRVREVVKLVEPEVVEGFSYGVPALKMGKKVLMFAGFKEHIGIYPGPQVIEDLKEELVGYEVSKGTIRLSLERELSEGLIRKIAKKVFS